LPQIRESFDDIMALVKLGIDSKTKVFGVSIDTKWTDAAVTVAMVSAGNILYRLVTTSL
jgi:hypothetical protein